MERKSNKQPKLHIKSGDNVIVIAGNSKGQEGVVKQVLVEKRRVIIEGVNMVTKHIKPSATNPQGGIEKQEGSIHISNVQLLEGGNPVRTGRKVNENGKLQRFSKKTGKFI